MKISGANKICLDLDRCPGCKMDKVRFVSQTAIIEECMIKQNLECNNCGLEWTNTYGLVSRSLGVTSDLDEEN